MDDLHILLLFACLISGVLLLLFGWLVWFGFCCLDLFWILVFETGFLYIVLAILELTMQTKLASNSTEISPTSLSQMLGINALHACVVSVFGAKIELSTLYVLDKHLDHWPTPASLQWMIGQQLPF